MEYQHGGDIYSNEVELDYSANINPFGMPEAVKAAIIEAVDGCIHYPDSRCRKLKEALAQYHHIAEEQIICTNGAAEAVFLAVQAVRPKKTALLAPTFSEYGQALRTVDSEIWEFYLEEDRGFTLNSGKFTEFLDETFDMAILCNPNNPTGKTVPGWDMEKILEDCRRKGIVLLVDECFLDFTDKERTSSLLPLCADFPDLMILKAFTKMYGMAGVRLGYLCSSRQERLEQMENLRQPWSVSALAQAAGVAAIRETVFAAKTRLFITGEREFVRQSLIKLGFKVCESEVNYLLFRDCKEAEDKDLYERCRQKKLLIRSCQNYNGLSGKHYRICIRTREENVRMLEIFSEVMKERAKEWQM